VAEDGLRPIHFLAGEVISAAAGHPEDGDEIAADRLNSVLAHRAR
jgi:hypothetical protein